MPMIFFIWYCHRCLKCQWIVFSSCTYRNTLVFVSCPKWIGVPSSCSYVAENSFDHCILCDFVVLRALLIRFKIYNCLMRNHRLLQPSRWWMVEVKLLNRLLFLNYSKFIWLMLLLCCNWCFPPPLCIDLCFAVTSTLWWFEVKRG